MAGRVSFALVGGFLGAGKTSLLIELARSERERGRRVAIITNDQGCELVDSRTVAALGISNAEVTAGCFCCRFGDLITVARLIAESNPDLIVAEAVGSCTDLVATVHSPMRRLHNDVFELTPVTIVVDPARVVQLLDTDPPAFPEEVVYLFQQQVAEGDVILLNKVDDVPEDTTAKAESTLRRLNPTARFLRTSAVSRVGIEQWLDCLKSGAVGGNRSLGSLDYERYGQAEAHLAWLNSAVEMTSSTSPLRARDVLERLTREISVDLGDSAAESAHVKLVVSDPAGNLSQANLTILSAGWRWASQGADTANRLKILINARVCTDPERLKEIIHSAVEKTAKLLGATMEISHFECFRPAQPVPTHRDVSAIP